MQFLDKNGSIPISRPDKINTNFYVDDTAAAMAAAATISRQIGAAAAGVQHQSCPWNNY